MKSISQFISRRLGTRNIPITFEERHAKLGCIVLRVLPKVMQTILKECMSPNCLQVKYRLHDIRTALKENETSLMEKLPNMDDFTIDLCYKILRYENLMLEPSCKWGNAPNNKDIDIADDIQRLLIATNEIIVKKSEDVSEVYYEEFQTNLHAILYRVDIFLRQDTCLNLYKTICRSEIQFSDILQELALLQQIDLTHVVDENSENRERYSRMSLAIIDTFPNICRDIIRSIISPRKMYQMCIQHLHRLSTDQKTCLHKIQSSNSYDSLDISMIYKLLRQFSLVPPPTKGWGNIPDKVDIKLSDDIERIRLCRNQLAHRCSTHITQMEFDNYFDQFRDIGHRIDLNFFQKTNYEYKINGHKTCRMDTQMETKYINTLKELENLRLIFEKHPIKFYWGDSFVICLMNLRSMLKSETSEGRRRKVRVQIIFQNEADTDRTIDILNSIKDEINDNLSGIEFIVATKGSIVLTADVLVEILEKDELCQSTLTLFLRKVLERIPTCTSNTESIDMILLPVEDYTQWKVSNTIGEPVCLNFDIEAGFFETDDQIEEQLRQISDGISKNSNGCGTNIDITATLLPICLENTTTTEESFTQAQTPVKYNLPVSVTLSKQISIKKSTDKILSISSCIKTGNTLVFTDCINNRLISCNSDSTNIQYISLHYTPYYITVIDSNTVAVSCSYSNILIINIYTCLITSRINTSPYCRGISYNDNNLYVVIDMSIIHVMDLTSKVIRAIPAPSNGIFDITVYRDRLICTDNRSIYCCSLDGKVMWKVKKDKYKDLARVTTDNEGNVYVTDERTHTVIVVSDDGQHHKQLLTNSDGLYRPRGIYFDKKENILLVCNARDGKVFMFDVKK